MSEQQAVADNTKNYMALASFFAFTGDSAMAAMAPAAGEPLGISIGGAIGTLTHIAWFGSKATNHLGITNLKPETVNAIQRFGFQMLPLAGLSYIAAGTPLPVVGGEAFSPQLIYMGAAVVVGSLLGALKQPIQIGEMIIQQHTAAFLTFATSTVALAAHVIENPSVPGWIAVGSYAACNVLGALSRYLPERKI